jgi:hypothetical protein
MAMPLQCLHYPFPGNGVITLSLWINLLITHKVFTGWLLILLQLITSDLRRLYSPISIYSKYKETSYITAARTKAQKTQPPILLLDADHTQNTASSIVAWSKPHRRHSSYCRVLLCCLATGRYVTILLLETKSPYRRQDFSSLSLSNHGVTYVQNCSIRNIQVQIHTYYVCT